MRMASEEPRHLYNQFSRLDYTVCNIFNRPVLPIHIFRRIWDVENKRKQKSVIVVKSKERGARTRVTACAYSPDGNMIGGG